MALGAKFATYAPHFMGPIQPDESVEKVLELFKNDSLGIESKLDYDITNFGRPVLIDISSKENRYINGMLLLAATSKRRRTRRLL